MQHTIESEKLVAVHFKKVLASESISRRGYGKTLLMSIVVDHHENYIAAKYTVTFVEYARRDGDEPVIREWEFSAIDPAVDKYNKLGR